MKYTKPPRLRSGDQRISFIIHLVILLDEGQQENLL
jgi:hypothetical protein